MEWIPAFAGMTELGNWWFEMISLVLLRKQVRDIRERKYALLILIMIAAIGVGGFVGMLGVYYDLYGARQRYYANNRLADFTINMKRGPLWLVERVASVGNVVRAEGRVSLPVQVDLAGREDPITATAVSVPAERQPLLNALTLLRGVWISGEDRKEVIIDDTFATANGLGPGNVMKVTLFDEQVEFLVVGTALSPEFVNLIPPDGGWSPDPERYGIVYIEEKFMQDRCDLAGAYNEIVGSVHDRSRTAVSNMLELIEDELEPYGVLSSVPYWQQPSVSYLEDELTGLKVSVTIVPTIFLGVSLLALNILMGRMVKQQRVVIGTLRSLGYSAGDIRRHYLGYGLSIGLAAGLLGDGFGWWLQGVMLDLYGTFYRIPDTRPEFYLGVYGVGFLLSVGAAMLGTVKGVFYASRLEPADAMRPPPPEKGGKIFLERVGFFWNHVSFRWKLILRSIFRNPFRSGVSLLASLIATSLIYTTLAQNDSLQHLMNFEFEKISHQDYTITLRDPQGLSVANEIGGLPGVTAVERQLVVGCDFARGSLNKRLGIIGAPKGAVMHTPLDKNGERILIPADGLVLSRKLAEILEVEVGERLTMRPLMGRRTTVETTVMGISENYFGLTAYADMDYLSGLLGEARVSNVVLCRRDKTVAAREFIRELKRRSRVVGIGERGRLFTQMHETFGQMMGTMMVVMIFFAGLIAFGSVLNTAMVSVSERQREIGSLRVLGYTNRQVAAIFSGESLVLNFVGIFLGLYAGIGQMYFVARAYDTELYRFPAVIKFSSLGYSALWMVFFAGLAQLIVYRIICKLEWLDVLKVKE